MRYWLHRISYYMNVSYPLLEKGYLSIGFSDFCDKEFLDNMNQKNDDEAWNCFEAAFVDTWGNTPKNRYNLWRFVKEMKKGDMVLVPSWGTFSIYELLEDNVILASDDKIDIPDTDWNDVSILRDSKNMLQLKGVNDSLDLGFLRKVKLICKDISRSDYADSALTLRMKIRCTNADISDLEDSIINALKSYNEKKPINLKADLMKETVMKWKSVIQNDLNPDKFEKLVKWYFTKAGASNVYILPKNSENKQGDADVIAIFEKIKTIISVQVKFYQGETSDWAVQQIVDFSKSDEGNKDDYNSQFWVISSSDSFSDECNKMAKEKNVRLINGIEFISMLLDVGIDTLEEFEN